MKYFLAVMLLVGLASVRIDVAGPSDLDGRISRMPAASQPAADEPPAAVRVWYFNPDGSCVQLAIGIHGIRCNVPSAATLPFDTHFGPAVRGGSWPARVAEYCDRRGIAAFNVTGEVTWAWMAYAADTGRGAAIGADYRHFQTLLARDAARGLWYVCDNRVPKEIHAYTDAEFRRLHLASGQWVVILDCHAPPAPPRYVRWW